jgi:threonine synthase
MAVRRKDLIMRLVSTTGHSPPSDFRTALFQSLAPDGGLYTPESLTPLAPAVRAALRGKDLQSVAMTIARHLLGDEFDSETLDQVVTDALDFPIPLTELDDGVHLLELFHGPTLAFKDVGARFMARVMSLCRSGDEELTVLVATSGDTGSAVAQAFLGLEGTRIVVLFPDGQVSEVQERQFTTLGDNVTALAVSGTFDDCQRLAKKAFSDHALRQRVRLTSANSINIGRLLPQIFYYFGAWAQLPDSDRDLVFCVPSGNFGNLTAGLMAKRLGLEVDGFVAATNINDVVPQCLRTGHYSPRPSQRTISNAMDVGDPSNFVRILHLYDRNLDALRSDLISSSHTDEDTRRCIREVYDKHSVFLDPHTAVGYLGLRKHREFRDRPMDAILLGTAHPAKFGDTVGQAAGAEVPMPERLAAHLQRERRVTPIAADYDELVKVLVNPVGG